MEVTMFPMQFIAAGTSYSTLKDYVPAPYLRRVFSIKKQPEHAQLLIGAAGFYDLYLNGCKLTKGLLAPYINNPDDIIYYDRYEVESLLTTGENVIGVVLGNGMQNNPGGYVWDFDKARFRGAPKFALRLDMRYGQDEPVSIESDESFVTVASPIYNDDLRNGEYYDARRELPGWNLPGFDDSAWKPAVLADKPRGEARLCRAEPIVTIGEIKPVAITRLSDGWLYDFGANCAGLCRLCIEGAAGQQISLYHGEWLNDDGRLNMRNISFDENDYVQKDIYICRGGTRETYMPTFTYHGFRYVFVKGFTERQATAEALTYLVMNSDLRERGDFSCSDATANTLQTLTRRSTLANFYYFPTDCPQREKNGWTADAALSAEHTLLNLSAENSYREWLHNIRKAQNDAGALPGIVPTGGWGFKWGNGPAWDSILIWLPYTIYLYRHDKTVLQENAHAILRYLDYLSTKIRSDGLIACGLGDWCPAGRGAGDYKSPLHFTDTVVSIDLCGKAAFIFGELDMQPQRDFALALCQKLRTAARSRLLDLCTMTAEGSCQTSQAMAIYYDIFEPGEKPEAFRVLLQLIHQEKDHLDVGMLGARVLFHVLAEFGYAELAFQMITQTSFPSYGWWVEQGATSLWEQFQIDLNKTGSFNHHFWGDISHFFIRQLAGICYSPNRCVGALDICPKFIPQLQFAKGHHNAPEGLIRVEWRRQETYISLDITVPDGIPGSIRLPQGYLFEDGTSVKSTQSGIYKVVCS